MQISQLPASNSFSSSDVIAIEIDGVTYKITGATLAAALCTIIGALPVANGGTGATDADNALTNIGAAYGKWGSQLSSFAAIPSRTGMYSVVYTNSSDSDAPITTSGIWWWNVIQFGSSSRITQIAYSAFRNRDTVWFRQKHDNTWYGWYKLVDDSSTDVAGSTGVALSSTEGSISQYTAIKNGRTISLAFVFTTSAAKTSGDLYTINMAFAEERLSPAQRLYVGNPSGFAAIRQAQLFPNTSSAANLCLSTSASVSAGAAFWVTLSYTCTDV